MTCRVLTCTVISAATFCGVSDSIAARVPPTAQSVSTAVADCLPEFDPSKPCRFPALGANFEVTALGLCKRIGVEERPAQIQLPLPKNCRIDRVLYGEFLGDLLLVYEISDRESGWGTAVRLEPRTLAIKWRLGLPGFNLSEGTIEEARLYQAGFGFVAAIDLTRGRYVWKHRGLYDHLSQSFNAFQRPEVVGTEVVFREKPATNAAISQRTVRVEKATGKISFRPK